MKVLKFFAYILQKVNTALNTLVAAAVAAQPMHFNIFIILSVDEIMTIAFSKPFLKYHFLQLSTNDDDGYAQK